MATTAGFRYLDVEKGTPRPRFPTLVPLHDFCDGCCTALRTRVDKCRPQLQSFKARLREFGSACWDCLYAVFMLAVLAIVALVVALVAFSCVKVLQEVMLYYMEGDSVQLTVTGVDVAGGGVTGGITTPPAGANITTTPLATAGSGGGGGGGGLEPELPAYGPLNLTLTVAARNPNPSLRVRYDALYASVWSHGRTVGAAEIKGVFVQPGHSTRHHRMPLTVAAVDRELAADMAHGVVPVRAELTATYQFRLGPLRSAGSDDCWVCHMSVTPPGLDSDVGRWLAATCEHKS